MSSIKNIGILGAGTAGCGIALAFALEGYDVKMLYVYDDKQRGGQVEEMTENLRILCDNGLVTESEIEAVISRVGFTEDISDFAGYADMIIECLVEKLEVKQDYFAKLDKLCSPSTILATNTSAISVTEIAERSIHRERIIGTHFWKPAYLIPLVEVVRTKYVCEDVVNQTYEFLEDAGKMPVIVKKDIPGFMADRMQQALFREALSLVENDIASPEDVDKAIKYGFGMRLGVMPPIEVIDSGGIDLTYNIHKNLFPHIENSTEPSKLLTERLNEGKLGFKTGEGIMKWSREDIEMSQKNMVEGLIRIEKALGRI